MPFPTPSTLAWWLFPAVLLAVVLQSGLPLRYNARNVIVRWRSTLATVLGIGLVVAVYVLLQALAQGIERNSGNTGDPRNVLVVRKGSQAESSSLVTREQFRALLYLDEIARNDRDEPVISADRYRLKWLMTAGDVVSRIRTTASSGTICPVAGRA